MSPDDKNVLPSHNPIHTRLYCTTSTQQPTLSSSALDRPRHRVSRPRCWSMPTARAAQYWDGS